VKELDPLDLPPGGEPVDVDDLPWDAWHPEEVAERLSGVRTPWYVAGGWALDLFRGEQTREHEDLEIAVPQAGFAEVREALDDHDVDVVGEGHRWPLGSAAFDLTHQTWVRDRLTGVYRLDVFREPHDGSTWICRRDPSIRRPYADIVRTTAEGVPYLVPEVVVLFKAKASRPKDEADVDGVLPLLDAAARRWLAGALDLVHPGHPWRPRLASGQG
jgi:hypothetical protein